MSRIKIAAQLFTVRDLLKGKNDQEVMDVLTEVKSMGYDAIQVSGIGEVTPEVVELYRKCSIDLDLDICATHFGLAYMEDNLEWVIDLHHKWSCSYAGIGSMPNELRNEAGLDTFITRCNALGKQLKAAGIQLVYHNHKFEFEKIQGMPWLQYLLDGFDPDYVQLEIDTYWVQAGGANPVSWINKVQDKMGIVHFKDMRIIKDEQQFAEIGQGNLEWPVILAACEQAGVIYGAVEQDSYTDDPLNSLRMSIDYLKSLG